MTTTPVTYLDGVLTRVSDLLAGAEVANSRGPERLALLRLRRHIVEASIVCGPWRAMRSNESGPDSDEVIDRAADLLQDASDNPTVERSLLDEHCFRITAGREVVVVRAEYEGGYGSEGRGIRLCVSLIAGGETPKAVRS